MYAQRGSRLGAQRETLWLGVDNSVALRPLYSRTKCRSEQGCCKIGIQGQLSSTVSIKAHTGYG